MLRGPGHGVGHEGFNCRSHRPLRSPLKKGGLHMQVIIAVIALVAAVGTIIFLGSLDINGAVKAALVAMVVLIAVFSMARIQPKETTSENTAKK